MRTLAKLKNLNQKIYYPKGSAKTLVISILFIGFLLFGGYSFSQSYEVYWVEFEYKANTQHNFNSPEDFLSERSVKRRQTQRIELDSADLPVNVEYKSALINEGLRITGESKWLNGVLIQVNDSSEIQPATKQSFIKAVNLVYNSVTSKSLHIKGKFLNTEAEAPSNSYEASRQQLAFHGGYFLHNLGFKGSGILIGVLDAGFISANELPVFKRLYDDKRLFYQKDLVSGQTVYSSSTHGTNVLSLMAGYQDKIYTGTAPLANYMLFKTEDVSSEFPIEEIYWAMAAEAADSIGVDIINSSLGYATFNDSTLNYSYTDLVEHKTFVSKAATIASEKGILVVTSAGNEGNDPWRYLLSPADAQNALSVGAVDASNNITNFSSIGFDDLPYIKPDIVALGRDAFICSSDGKFYYGSGTSYSAPIISGLSACLWQAFPDMKAQTIKEAIVASSDKYDIQDLEYGHGLPDFEKAYNYILQTSPFKIDALSVKVIPHVDYNNSNVIELFIYGPVETPINIEIFNITGQKVYQTVLNNYDKRSTVKITLLRQHNKLFIVKLTGANANTTAKFYKP